MGEFGWSVGKKGEGFRLGWRGIRVRLGRFRRLGKRFR